MVRGECLPIQKPEYFMDAGHLNSKGAALYSNFFHRVVSAPEEENSEYFYSSYQEKMEKEKPEVYGLYCYLMEEAELQPGDEPDRNLKMTIAATRKDDIECQIFLTPEGGETYMFQDFSENREFRVPAQEHGSCEIIWRETGGTEAGSLEISY